MVMVVVVDDFEGGHLCTYFVLGIKSWGYPFTICFYIEKVSKDFSNQYL